MSFDVFRFFRLAVAGALAGLFIYLIINPSYAAAEHAGHAFFFDGDIGRQIAQALTDMFIRTLLLNATFSVMLGGMLILGDEYASPAKRVALRMGTVCLAGAVTGALTGVLAQFLFMAINLLTLGLGIIIARGIGWAVMGAGAGICVGWVLGGWKRAKMGVLGGLIGGLGGGLLFDAVACVTNDGSLSRFIGFILIGLATGAAVAIVEDIAKQSWVTVLNGAKEGRCFILTKPITTIGRNELADIPLFGDQSVQKDHARLVLQGSDVILQSASNTSVTVNGAQTQHTQLRPWDTFAVGRFCLRFHQKASRRQMAYVPQALPDLTSPQYRPSYASTNQTISQPAVRAATGNIALVTVAGPHLNQRFHFGPGAVRIGRELGCGIMLAQDSVVSRNHAELTWNGTAWTVRDLQSRNGLWVNGVRVTEHALSVGDQIGVGQTWLRVEGI